MNESREAVNDIFSSQTMTAVEVVDAAIERAAKLGASDIHIDPRMFGVGIRYRIDGQMELAGMLPAQTHEEVIARLKILAGARTDLHAVPQDGRFRASAAGESYTIRASFMPTYHGENAVLRLLPSSERGHDSFASLGFTPEHADAIGAALKGSNGLILAVGPTGSGKTTTLRVCLGLKAAEPISVMTLEDPVEFEVPGVRHVHIRESYGVTFSSGLRSALRQDPDVIMVGEVRDADTARTAVQTALTGHLVLSTLHTSSALDAIIRLENMGIERYLLAATLRLIVGQRLVRTICHACGGSSDGQCESCRGSGYRGRSVIAEALVVDDRTRSLIESGASRSALLEHAVQKGFRTMEEDAREKVEWGVTTDREALRALNS